MSSFRLSSLEICYLVSLGTRKFFAIFVYLIFALLLHFSVSSCFGVGSSCMLLMVDSVIFVASKRQKSEDTFGMNDEDWEVYKYIVRG